MDHHDEYDQEDELEATIEQLETLRELGVTALELEGMSMADAHELIAELTAERDAARVGRD